VKKRIYYWAYGSNLCEDAMYQRCPAACKVGPLYVPKAALVFRSCADVVYRDGWECPGGLWRITPECERALDLYEGVAHGLYAKRYLTLGIKGKPHKCLVYKMNERGVMPPPEAYLGVIAQGYRDFGLDLNFLDHALAQSWDEKNKTPYLRSRHTRKGRPTLALTLPEEYGEK
jgi:AIG2-like family